MPQSGHAQLLLRIQDHQGLLFSLREGWNAKVHKMKEFLCWEEVNRYLRPSFIHSFIHLSSNSNARHWRKSNKKSRSITDK